jgi:outer membrane protein assembly factor BamB
MQMDAEELLWLKGGKQLLFFSALLSFITATTGLTITEPVDGETYGGDWLTIRVIVENENSLPDSVHYSLNGNPVTWIPRLNTDWPTYMQNYQNHGYSESPAPQDNTILWSAPVTGTLHEFPTAVTAYGIVYYPQDSSGDSLYALDAATGEILWKFRTGYNDDPVTVVDGRLYTPSDSLWCLDALTGTRIWASAIGNATGSSVIVLDGLVYCANDISCPDSSVVSCLNADDGSTIWSIALYRYTFSCMAYWNGILVVPTASMGGGNYGSLYGIDAETGEILWENTDTDVGYWDSSPTIVDGIVYINDCSEKTFAFDVFTGEKVWEQTTGGGTATIAYHEGRLYFACEGTPYYCLDASTGNTQWTSPYAQHGSSGVADGLVFFGETVCPTDSARVIALNCETGAEVWSYKTSSCNIGFQGSPSITDGVMYYPCTDGYLYAFGTGLKYTYLDDLYAQVGSNELIVTSYCGGAAVAADTISFTVTGTGINLDASHLLNLSASPNPCTSAASVCFTLPEPGYTTVDIYDLAGRCVTDLLSTDLSSGSHNIQWDGRDDSGEAVSSGLYLCRIQSGGVTETTGLCLLR